MPRDRVEAGHGDPHAGLAAADGGVRRRLHLRDAGQAARRSGSSSDSTTRTRCSTRTWRSSASSRTRWSAACCAAGRWCATARRRCRKAAGTPSRGPTWTAGSSSATRAASELVPPEGHPPGDADGHARRRDRLRRGARGGHVRQRACGAISADRRGLRARRAVPVRNVHQASARVVPGLVFGAGAGHRRAVVRPTCTAHAGHDAHATLDADYYGDDRVADRRAGRRETGPRAHVRQAHQRALLGHAARGGPAVAPARAHGGVRHALRRGVRPPVHAVLPGGGLRDRATSDGGAAAADQRLATACTARRATSWTRTR